MMLSLLISISKQPGIDINIYLAPLIEHLKTLWDVSAYMFNAYRKQTFNLRAVLMWTINDFTLYRRLSRCTIKGYYGYPVCRINTCACWLPYSKIWYFFVLFGVRIHDQKGVILYFSKL